LKPEKDLSEPKHYRPILLLSHFYKLLERLLLIRLAPFTEKYLIEEQANFRPGRSTTAQWLNLTQHIDNSYQTKKITGAVYVDLTTAYDTVTHRLLLESPENDQQLAPTAETDASLRY